MKTEKGFNNISRSNFRFFFSRGQFEVSIFRLEQAEQRVIFDHEKTNCGNSTAQVSSVVTVWYLTGPIRHGKKIQRGKNVLWNRKNGSATPVVFQYKKKFVRGGGIGGSQRARPDDPPRRPSALRDLRRPRRRKHRKLTPPMQCTRANSCS